MGSLTGKKFVIFGVANERSIAWAITEAIHKEGGELAMTFLNDALEKRVRPLAESVGCTKVIRCDAQSDADLDRTFAQLKDEWGTLDGVIHSIAYANKEDLDKRFVETSREGFKLALDVSAYTLIGISQRAEPLMKENGGSIITLTYLGSEKVVPHYNVMGVAKAALESSVRYLAADLGPQNIRVNAISAGPIKTLAASGIPHFRDMLTAFAAKAPLRRNVSQEEVAELAKFYLSPQSSGITGEVTYVDCGFNIMGM